MTQSDLETTVRDFLNEPDTGGRFSSSVLTRYINRALDKTALAVQWPDGYVSATWADGTPYANEVPLLEDFLAILRVYVGGQELTPTSVPLMEGNQLEMYDQSGTAQQPEWKTLERAPYASPSTYPVTATSGVTGFPVPMIPGFPLRPAYYVRGANMGIVPKPTPGTTLSVEFIVRPPQLSSAAPAGITIFPEIFREAIANKACELAMASDKQPQLADYWLKKFQANIYDPRDGLLKWKKQLHSQFVERPVPVAYRTFYSGPVVGTPGTSRWP